MLLFDYIIRNSQGKRTYAKILLCQCGQNSVGVRALIFTIKRFSSNKYRCRFNYFLRIWYSRWPAGSKFGELLLPRIIPTGVYK